MKKRLLSLFLAILMVVAVFPLTLLTAFGAEDGEKTAEDFDYSTLYVDGAFVLLMAYNGDDSVTLNADGSGKWVNKVADPTGDYDTFDLVGKIGTIGGKTVTARAEIGIAALTDTSYKRSCKEVTLPAMFLNSICQSAGKR